MVQTAMAAEGTKRQEEIEELRAALQTAGSVSSQQAAATVRLLEETLSRLESERRETQRQLRWLRHSQHKLDERLIPIEQSRIFRAARTIGRIVIGAQQRVGRWLGRDGVAPTESEYRNWIQVHEPRLRPAPTARLVERPVVSLFLPTGGADPRRLEATLESLAAQTYPHWELCVGPGADSKVIEPLTRMAQADQRILTTGAGQSNSLGAFDRALRPVPGKYVGFLRAGDLLSPDAIEALAGVLQSGSPDLIYSDEDHLDAEGVRCRPLFKPDWSPDLLFCGSYPGNFLVVSSAALERAGNWCEGLERECWHELPLRLAPALTGVHHIPQILYHASDNHAETTGAERLRMAEDAVQRLGWNATVVEDVRRNTLGLRWRISGEPLASIIICSRNAQLLVRCLRAIRRRTSYQHREIVVLEHVPSAGDIRKVQADFGCVCVRYSGPFNFAAMNNRAVQAARGDHLAFVNDDVAPLAPEWLERLIAHLQRPRTAIAGARLLYPSGAIQHAGVAVGISDGAGHPLRGSWVGRPHWPWDMLPRSVSAVTGACLAISREAFHRLGGFDERFPVNYNDVDLCLRARRAGYDVIFEPAALLRHREAGSRLAMTRYSERELLYERWAEILDRGDPFYNLNLTRTREDASLRDDL